MKPIGPNTIAPEMNRILPVAEFCYDIYSLCKILEHSNLNNG
jgi:hypothetical protein